MQCLTYAWIAHEVELRRFLQHRAGSRLKARMTEA
jgi:hypothetical protein